MTESDYEDIAALENDCKHLRSDCERLNEEVNHWHNKYVTVSVENAKLRNALEKIKNAPEIGPCHCDLSSGWECVECGIHNIVNKALCG